MSKIKSSLSSFLHAFQVKTRTLKLSTPAAIIVAACILGASHVVYGFVVNNNGTKEQTVYFTGKPIDDADYVEGNTKNDVFVIEYSDPECPYCISLHPTMKQIRSDYGEKVGFVYRHFPLTQIHPNAHDESKAIACAGLLGGTQGLYSYVDSLYGYKLNGSTTELPPTGKEDIAVNGGLDREAFTACMDGKASGDIVDLSLNDGIQAGVEGTPTTFVLSKTRKGYEVIASFAGARQYEFVKATIDQALAK